MQRNLAAPVIAAIFSFAATAQAASLADVVGAVAVDRGHGFEPGSIGTPLSTGDRVRVGDGSADIIYDDGCAVKVRPQQIQVVAPTCKVGGLKDGGTFAPPPPEEVTLGFDDLAVGGAVGLAVAFATAGSNGSSGSPLTWATSREELPAVAPGPIPGTGLLSFAVLALGGALTRMRGFLSI